MKTGTRLTVYGLGLVVAFGGAFGISQAVIPSSVVSDWAKGTESNGHGNGHDPAAAPANAKPADTAADSLKGLSLGQGGYVISPVKAPAQAKQQGQLSFTIRDATGAPVTHFKTAHEKDLHLIVTRSDGSQFRHVHPVLDKESGTWTTPWEWDAAGSYRVFADFTPAAENAQGLTLTRTVQVAGEFTPVAPQPSRVAQVDGFTVTLDGDLAAGTSSKLKLNVARDGKPVTTLEPYLGAFGHLVALREGDLAYLHVHAEGEEPQPGQTSGPEIAFAAEAPTAGRYLLYLDFQVDGKVRTAEFVVDAAPTAENQAPDDAAHQGGH
ncbi:heavy-metal-associated domain-containing protein [Galactobacter caseinivorans]|uniref:Heavy-metal-associated domain-containing protein n=1 Tax=Galactobacter caseinivorans TaxID=2676123 RepID=A0A496PKF4_9MICC|nr:heavy-metal-associated domain-containing protein [Galactobacter caseinivorans]RKW70958.1 heavy-metal-associated domain-containing protein [Galactobacter caseinivorans]